MKIIDLEAVIKSLKEYLMEELEIEGSDEKISRLNYYINDWNLRKGDDLLDAIPNETERFIFSQRRRETANYKQWIDINAAEDITYDNNFTAVAKTYIISLSNLIYDDYSDAVFFKATRMSEVLVELMKNFLSAVQTQGLMFGQLENGTIPQRVALKGSKALKSGVTYIAVIQ